MKESIQISRLHKGDLNLFKQLVELLNEVFEEYNSMASEKQLGKLLVNPEFYAVIAMKNDTVVAGFTAYELQRYYSDNSELYIYDIAVKKELQNQGIGKKLIDYLKQYGMGNNVETIFVEAHSEDEQAVRFYESTFGKSEKVDHFNFEIQSSNNANS